MCRLTNVRMVFLSLFLCLSAAWRIEASVPPVDAQAVRSGCEPDYLPYCLVTPEGQADGFSVELLRAVLEKMGRSVSFKIGEWSGLKQELSEGGIQVLPLVGRTPERETIYDFTFPYLTMDGTIIVRKDQTNIRASSDLAGKKAAVLKGDNAEEYLRHAKLGAEIITLPSFETALVELSEGKHDAVVIQKLLAFHLIQQAGITNLTTAVPRLDDFKQSLCFAVRKGDRELLAVLNEGLSLAMADGTFRALSAKWFSGIEQAVRTSGRIVLGGDINSPPYEFLDETGLPAGFNVDITKAIAHHMDMSVEIHLGDWDDVRKGLNAGAFDMVQSMYYSDDRARTYSFSPVNTYVEYTSVTRRGGAELSDIAELAGKTIVVMKGDIMHDLVLMRGFGDHVIVAPTQEDALKRLVGGEGDYALVAKIPAHFWVAENGWKDLRISEHPILSAESCFAALPENKELLDRFSEGLSILKQTGEFREIQAKWLSPYEKPEISFKRVMSYLGMFVVPLLIMLGVVVLWSWSLRRQVSERTKALVREMAGHNQAEARAQKALNQERILLAETDSARKALLSLIEDQKQSEERLRDSEGRFRSLYNSMSEGFALHRMVYDADGKPIDYVVESVNPAYERMFGRKAGETVGKLASEVFGSKELLSLDVCAHVAETGEPGNSELFFEPEGRMFFLSVSSPSKGFFATLFEDVTERARADAEHNRLMAAIEQSGEIIVITDTIGTVQYVNPAFIAARGWRPEEVIGRNLRMFKSGENSESVYREMWTAISSGKTWRGRFVNRRKNGTPYTEEATISPVFGKTGKIINYTSVSRDIMERLHMAEQLHQAQKMESVGRLAGGVAHDFNNMLAVILGNSELAMSRLNPTDALYGDLLEIRKAAERSADLTRQLLAFARKQTVVPKVVDLNDTVGKTLKMLRRLIGEAIELVWRPGSGDTTIKVDPSQVDQILANLAINARDAIAGVGKLTIETRNTTFDSNFCAEHADTTPGEYVMLLVSDTGCGMDEATLKHVFEPFFTTKDVGKGTGLGLATVYGIVKQNNGFINIYSEPGLGTTFKIYLPRFMGKVEAPLGDDALPLRCHGDETILLVEDEPAILAMGKTLLEKLGYTVSAAASPTEAIRLATSRTGGFNLLLTDMIMPEMNGQVLSTRLLALCPDMKCVYMSGYTADAINSNNILDKGVNFLQKPFTMKELAAKVRAVLDAV